MLTIGCHLSAAKGFAQMGRDAVSIGANTFQYFTRNPRGSKARAIDEADVAALLKIMEENHFGQVIQNALISMPMMAVPHTRARSG